jgi:hypothetical protein
MQIRQRVVQNKQIGSIALGFVKLLSIMLNLHSCENDKKDGEVPVTFRRRLALFRCARHIGFESFIAASMYNHSLEYK